MELGLKNIACNQDSSPLQFVFASTGIAIGLWRLVRNHRILHRGP